MPVAHTITLANAFLVLDLVPAWGGRIARLRAVQCGTDILLPIEATAFDPVTWPRGGCYPLAPYSNRIACAQLLFQEQHYALPAHPRALPHTLHGVAHTLRWAVVATSDEEVTIEATYDGEHWPWAFRVQQNYRLHGAALAHSLSIVNLGATDMPAGLGLHPYFCVDDSSRASFVAQAAWAMDADCLPDGARTALDASVQLGTNDFRTREYVGYYSGWDGRASIASDAGTVSLWAKGDLAHLVAFAPAGGNFLCLEPVSHVADGFNLAAAGQEGAGTRTLAPGETFTVALAIAWKPRQA